MSAHGEHAARQGVAVPCAAWHQTFGGRCLNCGFSSLATRVEPVDPGYRVGPPPRVVATRAESGNPLDDVGCITCGNDLTVEDGARCRQCVLQARYGRKDR